MNKFKEWLIRVLKLSDFGPKSYDIRTLYDFKTNVAKNIIWYRGDSNELSQFYAQLPNYNQNFWGSVETKGLEIRKIHTGLPKLIVDTLANITISDLYNIKFENDKQQELWNSIAKDNEFKRLILKSTKNVLKLGDGAFKISFKENVSKYPLLDFYNADRVSFEYDRGRLREVIFYDYYKYNDTEYTLFEIYGYGYIKYKLYRNDLEVDINAIPHTKGLEDVEFDKDVILACPYMIFESDEFEGRGQSIFDGKIDSFDSLDEVVSQWIDSLRAGRTKVYIPESLIPKDPNGGFLLRPNAFDNRFIKTESDMSENAKNEIKTEQPNLQTESYLSTYITMLDLCLQGIISPSTLGIDTKKLDNAEAQREKEKTTLYTRQTIIFTLTEVIKKLVKISIEAYSIQYDTPKTEIEPIVEFGEYASPSFEAVCETLSKARPGQSIMSVEAQVEELWGDSKTDKWKKTEVNRIKEENGILISEEPSENSLLFSEDINLINDQNDDSDNINS